MHQVVRSLLIRAIQIYEGNEEALRSGQGRLANAYRTRWENNNSGARTPLSNLTILDTNATPSISDGYGRTPLETLAEVARSRLPNDHDTSGAASNSPSGAAGARNGSSASVAVGACNEGTTTGQVQTWESREAAPAPITMYGQTINSPWQTKCPQQTAAYHVPLNGAHDPPLFGLDQGSMTMGAGAVRLQDGSNPRVSGLYVGPSIDVSGASNDHPPDFAVRISGFRETNRANCETSGQAHSPQWPQGAPTTNATYDQALHSSLAQLGDDTTEYDNSLDWANLVKNLYNDIGEGYDGQ